MHDDEDFEDENFGPSKSARKRDMHALQALGTRLTELSDAQLRSMPIDDEKLKEAVDLARRIKSRSALRRQLQYIGKLMRSIDPAPIEEAFARIDGKHEEDKARFHRLETLRDSLLQQGDAGMDAVLAVYPHADRQPLRQLLRQHSAEQKNNKPATAARKLFRYLRELDEAAAGEAGGGESGGGEEGSEAEV